MRTNTRRKSISNCCLSPIVPRDTPTGKLNTFVEPGHRRVHLAGQAHMLLFDALQGVLLGLSYPKMLARLRVTFSAGALGGRELRTTFQMLKRHL